MRSAVDNGRLGILRRRHESDDIILLNLLVLGEYRRIIERALSPIHFSQGQLLPRDGPSFGFFSRLHAEAFKDDSSIGLNRGFQISYQIRQKEGQNKTGLSILGDFVLKEHGAIFDSYTPRKNLMSERHDTCTRACLSHRMEGKEDISRVISIFALAFYWLQSI